MDLFIEAGDRSLSGQIYEQIRAGILDGRFRPADKLPPSRLLARQLGLSRHTVTTAYTRLVAEGYLEGRAGGGSAVARGPSEASRQASPATALTPNRRFAGLTAGNSPLTQAGCRYDLRVGLADPALFPAQVWRRHITAAARALSPGVSALGVSGDPAGEAGVRRTIARWISRSRSVVAEESTVVVTSGAQHAIDLIARILLEPGDTVVVEDPGYRPVASSLRGLGANVVGVRVDEQGLVVDELPSAARIVYITPSHQFPLGVAMSMPRRLALLRWAEQHDAAVIEDDYDSEFRHADRPLEPIQRLDVTGRVVYVGSFSKSLSSALRLGFIVAPISIMPALAAQRQLIDWHPPIAAQQALAELIDGGLLDRHLRHAAKVYTERHRLLDSALAGPLAAYLAPIRASAGLHICALLRGGLDEATIGPLAFAAGIACTGLSDHYQDGPAKQGLVIGFGAIATKDLPVALELLAEVLAAAAAPTPDGASG